MFQTKVVDKIKTHFMLNNCFFFFDNRAVYEIMWKNMVERGRPQMAIWRMRTACWTPNATNTHSPHVTLIAFPPQQWLRERTSMLRYTHIACLARLPITQNGPPSQHPAVQLTIPRHLVPKARTEWSCTSVSICILMA